MIKKVISGGQTGADQAGLIAAKEHGIETGGWMPKGFLTENGSCPELGELFGLQEHSSAKYPLRTYANVKDSDGTIRFAYNFNSPGERCTLKAIKQYGRPHIDVSMLIPSQPLTTSQDIVKWIVENDIHVLNVAGNRMSSYKKYTGINLEFLVVSILGQVFRLLKKSK